MAPPFRGDGPASSGTCGAFDPHLGGAKTPILSLIGGESNRSDLFGGALARSLRRSRMTRSPGGLSLGSLDGLGYPHGQDTCRIDSVLS